MKVLVTGGSGFIGSHLVDKLLADGHEVVIFDKEEPIYNSAASYFRGNILDLAGLMQATKGVDYIYHLAAEANVDIILKTPVYSTQVNTIGTVNVLEAARENKCKRVIFASTDWVYGGVQVERVDEQTSLYPPAPDHIYMAGKIASEMYLYNYYKLYGVNYTVMRFGIPFGPHARPATVTYMFLAKAFKGEPVTIHGSGEQFRQFIYVEDLAEGCVACLKDKAANQIFNLNGPEKVSVKRIAETIKKLLLDYEVKINCLPGREGDFKGRLVDSSKALELLGWRPKHSYEEAMRKYIPWFKENIICSSQK
jgi:UDP-glucose 4-epimerase